MSEKPTYEELEQRIEELEKKETQRSHQQDALQEGEEIFKHVFESANVGKSITSPTGRVTVNQAFADMLGYTREELAGKTWQDITPPEEVEDITQKLAPLLAGDQTAIRFQKRYMHKNGAFIWTDESAVLRRSPDGKPLHFIKTIVDISERKQAEEELIANQERYRSLFENTGTAMLIIEEDMTISTANSRVTDYLSLKGEEIVGHKWPEFIHPEDLEKMKEEHTRRRSDPENASAQYEAHVIDKDGNSVFVIVSANLITGTDKTAISLIDITERKRVYEELKRRNLFIESVMDNLPIGLAVNSISDGDVRYVNSAYEEIYGWSRNLVTNTSIFFDKVFPDPEYKKTMKSQIISDMQSGDPNRMVWNDVKIVTNSGEERYVTAVNIPMIEQNLMISTVQNTTARKQAEIEQEELQTQLQQSQKMESVGRLAGGVAHDYNNMLSIIIGYSELSLEKIKKDDPLQTLLMEILKAAKRSADITRQLLTFARKQAIAPEVLDLENSIGSIVKMLRRLISEDIELAWLPGVEVWPIKMDPSQLDQVFTNLCINARDAIANVGKITIETKNVVFDKDYCAEHAGFAPGEYVLFTVSDDGCGMGPETQDSIFEPFFTTKDIGEGTGLGMAMVYGIVKQNNVFINVYSEIEKGTTIRIYLPRYTGQIANEHGDSIIEIPLSRGELVLLVEDDYSIMKLGKRILENLGYDLLSATSPIEAARLAAEHADEIHLLITDVVMPEMNGRELSEQLQSLYPDLKTLFISGYTADIIENRGELAEGVSFLAKPFSKKELAVRVREVLDEVKD